MPLDTNSIDTVVMTFTLCTVNDAANRKPDDLMESAGFRIESLETGYLKAPRAMGFVYSGSARPS